MLISKLRKTSQGFRCWSNPKARLVLKRLDEVASETARVLSLGQTLQGRLIPLVGIFSFTAPDAPLVVVGASPQCHELGTVTEMGILEAVLRGELDDVVRNYRLSLLPL